MFELRNDASIPLLLRVANASPQTGARTFTLPARGTLTIQIANIEDIDRFAFDVEVLNAFVDPERNLAVTLR